MKSIRIVILIDAYGVDATDILSLALILKLEMESKNENMNIHKNNLFSYTFSLKFQSS